MREDVTFSATDGTTLRGWYYRPEQTGGNWPVVVMSHGFGAVKEMYLDVVADGLLGAGLGCLVYDHRGFGHSGGEPRGESDPFLQVADARDAITEILAAYERACEPKRLLLRPGGHFDVYGIHCEAVIAAARDWFTEHLTKT